MSQCIFKKLSSIMFIPLYNYLKANKGLLGTSADERVFVRICVYFETNIHSLLKSNCKVECPLMTSKAEGKLYFTRGAWLFLLHAPRIDQEHVIWTRKWYSAQRPKNTSDSTECDANRDSEVKAAALWCTVVFPETYMCWHVVLTLTLLLVQRACD